jgi:hypothetical protein
MPTASDGQNGKFTELFECLLHNRMLEALRDGMESLEISAGELRERFGFYREVIDPMPNCCQAMRNAFVPDAGDAILEERPMRQPYRFRIRYVLPRPSRQKGA